MIHSFVEFTVQWRFVSGWVTHSAGEAGGRARAVCLLFNIMNPKVTESPCQDPNSKKYNNEEVSLRIVCGGTVYKVVNRVKKDKDQQWQDASSYPCVNVREGAVAEGQCQPVGTVQPALTCSLAARSKGSNFMWKLGEAMHSVFGETAAFFFLFILYYSIGS